MSKADIKLEYLNKEECVLSFNVAEEFCNIKGLLDETAVMLFIDNFSSICYMLIEKSIFPFTVSVDLGASFYYHPLKGQTVYLYCNVFKNKGKLLSYSMTLRDSDDTILASGRHTAFDTLYNHNLKIDSKL